MTRLGKRQAHKFWKELGDAPSAEVAIAKYKGKTGWPKRRTLMRYALAHNLFRDRVELDEAAQRLGLSTKRVSKIRGWWLDWTERKPPVVTEKAALTVVVDPPRGYVGTFMDEHGRKCRFAHVWLRNNGGETARDCRATLSVTSSQPSFRTPYPSYSLHWADTRVTLDDQTADPVDISAGGDRRLNVAFTQIRTPRISDVTRPAGRSTGVGSPHIGADLVTKLDFGPLQVPSSTGVGPMAYAGHGDVEESSPITPGCWIAIPLALARTDMAGQAYLPPGEYTVRLRVVWDESRWVEEDFRLISPDEPGGIGLEST